MDKMSGIVLAAGRGTRMQEETEKQFLLINKKPVLYYSLKAFEESDVDEIVLVVSEEKKEYCKKEIINKYGFSKVKTIVVGGEERYDSVANALESLNDAKYVLIHDGARPMVTKEIINANIQAVREYRSCVTAVLSKDTIKIVDEEFVVDTPERNKVWLAQTPQSFEFDLIKSAYNYFMNMETRKATDDCMVLEMYPMEKSKIKIVQGSYENIKITTSEDLILAEKFLEKIV